jgi:hypothetical protein
VATVEDELARAQHYRDLAAQMRKTAEDEPDDKRRADLIELANQYDGLAVKLIQKHFNHRPA